VRKSLLSVDSMWMVKKEILCEELGGVPGVRVGECHNEQPGPVEEGTPVCASGDDVETILMNHGWGRRWITLQEGGPVHLDEC